MRGCIKYHHPKFVLEGADPMVITVTETTTKEVTEIAAETSARRQEAVQAAVKQVRGRVGGSDAQNAWCARAHQGRVRAVVINDNPYFLIVIWTLSNLWTLMLMGTREGG